MLAQNCRAESNSCMYHTITCLNNCVYILNFILSIQKKVFLHNKILLTFRPYYNIQKKIKFVNCNFFASLFYKSVEFEYG